MSIPIGSILGSRYRVLEPIGRGGMGTIYRALHLVLRREVALKVIAERWAKNRLVRARHRAEARRAASIIDQHVVQIFDAGTLTDGRPYLVMELLRGRTLTALLRPGEPLPLGEALELGVGIGRGLLAAHRQGIVHRDLTPANVMVIHDNGWVPKILDFGLAAELDGEGDAARLTAPGTRIGTPLYMAPEQIACEQIGPAADVYALGELLFEMLSGLHPFAAPTAPEVFRRKRLGNSIPLRHLRPELPPELIDLVERCIARTPEDRPNLEPLVDHLALLCATARVRERPLP